MEIMAHLRQFSGRFVFRDRYSGDRFRFAARSVTIVFLEKINASVTAELRTRLTSIDLPSAIPLGKIIIIKLVRNTSRAGSNFAKIVVKRMD